MDDGLLPVDRTGNSLAGSTISVSTFATFSLIGRIAAAAAAAVIAAAINGLEQEEEEEKSDVRNIIGWTKTFLFSYKERERKREERINRRTCEGHVPRPISSDKILPLMGG